MDRGRIETCLAQIAAEAADLAQVLQRPDEEILAIPREMKSCKYSVIVISETMANTLQHILAREHNVAVSGYTEVFVKARQFHLVSEDLADRLQPFIRFPNMLVHQYWRIDERRFVENLRRGLADFRSFVRQIKEVLDKSVTAPNSGKGE